jgi:hypothetical protein
VKQLYARPWLPWVLLLAVAILFLILNRAAYKGYFQDDELDNIVMTRGIPAEEWITVLFGAQLSEYNFRPAGHVFFLLMERVAKLDFPKYIIPVHALHLMNLVLVWLLLRRLDIPPLAAVAGAAFFALNVAAFDAYWKPMYIFDILCTTWCLAALLLYAHGRWLLAIPAMWLAYKSKELAVMLPAVLAAYELWFGGRRWKRLIPFVVISLLFGVQAVLYHRPVTNPYSFVFTLAALAQTIPFYSSRLFFIPFAGFVLLIAAFVIRDRRVWLGAVTLALFFLPLVFLPGRMYAAYTYLPLTGAAIEMGAIAAMVPPAATLAFFLLWIPWNIVQLRADRKTTLTYDDDARIYVNGILDYARAHPNPPVFAFSSLPPGFHGWGLQAALQYPYLGRPVKLSYLSEPEARRLPPHVVVSFLNWDRDHRRLLVLVKDPSIPDASYITMNAQTPVWQLETGWYTSDDYFRWTEPLATARLSWPAEATAFEAVLNVGPSVIQKYGYTSIGVKIDGKDLGTRRFEKTGIVKVRWELPARGRSEAHIEFDAEPHAHYEPDPRLLGAAIVSFGFVTREADNSAALAAPGCEQTTLRDCPLHR